jgi:hypothetical protein
VNFADLLRNPTDETLIRFLEAWHGPAVHPMSDPFIGSEPEPIRRLAALSRRWTSAIVQNHLRLGLDPLEDGRRVFYVENQGVYEWATDGIADDPVVWGRFTNSSESWQAEREPLSRFVIQIAALEAIAGADHGAAAPWITLQDLVAALRPLERLPLGSWRWPREPLWFYAGEDVLATASPNGPIEPGQSDRFDLMISATNVEALGYLHDIEGIDWAREPY